jgi:hypothetical protein
MRRFNAFTRISAISIKVFVISRVFSVLLAVIRLKKVVFNNFSRLFFSSGAVTFISYSGL